MGEAHFQVSGLYQITEVWEANQQIINNSRWIDMGGVDLIGLWVPH